MEKDHRRRRGSSGALFTSLKCPPGPGLDNTCELPFGMLYSPFGSEEDDEEEDDKKNADNNSISSKTNKTLHQEPILCLTCLAYINLYVKIVNAEQGLWECSLCGARNAAPPSVMLDLHNPNNRMLVAPMYTLAQQHQQKNYHHTVSQSNATATTTLTQPPPTPPPEQQQDTMTIVLVVDANLPAVELQALAKALETLQSTAVITMSTTTTIIWGLVVFDEAVAVYHMGVSGMAAADVFVSHQDFLNDQQSQDYMATDDAGLYMVQTCLNALAAAQDHSKHSAGYYPSMGPTSSSSSSSSSSFPPGTSTINHQNNGKPLSRLERLKMAKAERQKRQSGSNGNGNSHPYQTITTTITTTTTSAHHHAMLDQSPWMQARRMAQSQRSAEYRCTGEAMQVAMDLATTSVVSRTSRIWAFTNGCPNLGDGSVVLRNAEWNRTEDALSDTIATTTTRTIDAFQMTRAVAFYKVLAQTAAEEGLAVDVFLTGAAELGLPAYQALVEPSAGYALVHESFTTPHLIRHLQYILDGTYVSHVRVGPSRTPPAVPATLEGTVPLPLPAEPARLTMDGCIIDVRFSTFLTPTHFVGPGTLLTNDKEKKLLPNERPAFATGASWAAKVKIPTHNLPSRDVLETSLNRFRVGRVDPLSTFSVVFQLNDFFQRDNFCFFQCVARYWNRSGTQLMTRVTTHRLPLAKDVGEFLDAVDEEVIPVVLAKEAVYRTMHGREVEGTLLENASPSEEQLEQLAHATQLDLDATVARVSNSYRLLGLQEGRRGLDLTEEGGVRAAGSSLDFAFPPELGEALKRLYHLRRGPLLSPGPMRSADDRLQLRMLFLRFPLEECLLSMAPCLWALMDDGTMGSVPAETLALWDSAVIAADNFHTLFVWSGKQALSDPTRREYCTQFLANRSYGRFPMPDLHLLADGDSMSRRFTALLSPSHGDPPEHSLAHFAGLDRLSPDAMASLRSKFAFYDASTDPSFRSWFWTVASATTNSKDEGWSLCE